MNIQTDIELTYNCWTTLVTPIRTFFALPLKVLKTNVTSSSPGDGANLPAFVWENLVHAADRGYPSKTDMNYKNIAIFILAFNVMLVSTFAYSAITENLIAPWTALEAQVD